MTAPSSEPPLSPTEAVLLVLVMVLFFGWGLLPLAAEFFGAYR